MNFPALELVWTPTGRPCVARGRRWEIGELAPIDRGLTFGLEGSVRLAWPSADDAREICKIDGDARSIRLAQYRFRAYPCVVNGRIETTPELRLRHGDLVALPRGPLLRVLESASINARSQELETALRADPFNEQRLDAWRDFLLAHQDPLGERLARWPEERDDARWLGVFAPHYEAGALQIDWNRGLAQKAVLRESQSAFDGFDLALLHLFALPVARFLEELTLELSSEVWLAVVADAVRQLSRVEWPSTLKRLSLGDLHVRERADLEPLLSAFPRPVDIGYFSSAELVVLECSSELSKLNHDFKAGARVAVPPADSRSALEQRGYLLAFNGRSFRVTRCVSTRPPANVNGRPVDFFSLRDGDAISLGGDLTATFRLVR